MSPNARLHLALTKKKYRSFLLAWESPLKQVILHKPSFFYQLLISKFKKYFIKYYYWSPYKNRKTKLPWSFNACAPNPLKNRLVDHVDIIHLDWIANGCLNLKDLKKIKKPIVWTLHDVWAITGGCHCNLGCEKWVNGCGACPQLERHDNNDISAHFWKAKKKALNAIPNLSVITPSNWLGNMAMKSQFFKKRKIQVIPNCLDTNLFKPINKSYSRKALNLPQRSKVVLFGAANAINTWYKGFDLLIEALNHLKVKTDALIHLVVFGASLSDIENIILPYPITCFDTIRDEMTLMIVYNSADVFVGPSRQDNFPNTFLEATSCGIPCVGFSVGGIPEIVEHQKNGYIAKPFDTSDLANGISWVLEDAERHKSLSMYGREKAINNYSMDVVAQKHIELYKQLLST